MKRLITLLLMTFMMTGYVSAQEKMSSEDEKPENVVLHKAERGETALMICKKYMILPHDFYRYNKEAIHGVAENTMLRIPMHLSKKKTKPANEPVNEAYASANRQSTSRGPNAD